MVFLCAVVQAPASHAQNKQNPAKHPITFEDFARIERISEPQISPDGSWVAYKVVTPDFDANRNAGNIWMISTQSGPATQLTFSGRDSLPVWSPDSQTLAFLSSRDGTPQIYLLPLSGGEARALTRLSSGADNPKWSPDGKLLAFTSLVYPGCSDDACNLARDAEREKSKLQARIYDQLLYRHWDHWFEYKRSHLFVVPADGSLPPRDLTPGADYDVPPDERGGPEDICFAPDSKELAFVAVTDKMEAISTNGDIFTVPVSGGEPKRLTTNQGFDGNPVYSPDGRYIAYHAQFTSEYESDRWRVMLYDRKTGTHENLTEHFDRWAMKLAWSTDSKTIYLIAEDETLQPIYALPAKPGAEPQKIVREGFNDEVSLDRDGRAMVFTRSSLTLPPEIFIAASDGRGARQLTHQNDARLALLDMNPPETFWFESTDGVRIQAMLIRPPGFDPAKKYPLLVLLHGGPQTMWGNSWGYRWNPQVFAAPGYVALIIERRGSTGYGQRFIDEITDDWGGRAYEDNMKGVDYVLAKYPFVDANRMAAAGGSYGGYMADWMATHTGRFKTLISHAGVFDKPAMYGSTEELWFEEHDMRGTPWTHPESYLKWSPLTYAGELSKFKTPMLIFTGERDYRVPYTQSLELFTALQRQGVPSKLVVFPDEGHWILKPLNAQLWYKTFLDWLATYLK
jgi:dipeptidyl aminopeptidase/acylaminoacyl peptidase